jgi:hypothetical protein
MFVREVACSDIWWKLCQTARVDTLVELSLVLSNLIASLGHI